MAHSDRSLRADIYQVYQVKFKHNPSFLTKTVEKFVPIKKFNNYYVVDTLYSDHVLFDT